MSPKTTTGRKVLDRLLIVAAVAAVLVSVGAWIALNRPGGAAEAAGASSSVSGSGGSFSETSGAPASGAAGSGDSAATAPDASASAAAAGGNGTGTGTGTSTGTGTGTSSGTGTGTGSSTRTGGGAAAPTSSATSGLSPTTAFLNALAASGLGPPVDDTQKLAMADDVCQELKNGSKYADVVRALTFAGASDEQAANFARLSITNLCPQFPVG